MPGSKLCMSCGDPNPSCSMFLTKGMFLNRTFIDVELSKPIVAKTIALEGIKNKTGQMGVCKRCCEDLLNNKESSEYFLGFLSMSDNVEYRSYARDADKLHKEGYLVVSRNHFAGCHVPLPDLLESCFQNKSRIETLPNGGTSSGRVHRTKMRSWMPLSGKWGGEEAEKSKNARRKMLQKQMTKIIAPDMHYGRIAMKNRYDLLGKPDLKISDDDWDPFVVKGEAVLYRAYGLENHQSAHADAHAGAFNIIEVLTNHYEIKVWKGSHLLPFWDNKHNTPTVHGIGTNPIIMAGQIMVFHSNLVHCGGRSCQRINNFSTVEAKLRAINNERTNQIKWFGTGDAARNFTLTDMSLHYTVDSTLGQMSEGDYSTGAVEIFRPLWEKKKCCIYSGAIKTGLTDYQKMKMPGRADNGKPCGSLILDVDKVLDRYHQGRGFASGVRKSLRLN